VVLDKGLQGDKTKMKRFAMVATILLAGCLAAGAEAENLLKNGSFELGLEGWLPPSWLQNL